MTKASDVRDFFKEGRRLVEQDLDIAEQFKAMRDAARTKNVDWSQVKALLKAQILDERDGTDKRVRAIVEKADCASAYADMLGLSENKKTREENYAPTDTAMELAERRDATDPANPYAIPPDLSIPPFLKREPATAN